MGIGMAVNGSTIYISKFEADMNKVIVIGHDAVNALGLVQSLGREGLYVIAILEDETSFLIKSSKHIGEIHFVNELKDVPDLLLYKFAEENKIPLFAAGDGVALMLDQNYDKLKEYFLFEHAYGEYAIEHMMNKELQIRLAQKHNFNVPKSFYLHRPFGIPADMVYPCIVKPLVSCLGDKRDILIADNAAELKDVLENCVTYSNDVIVQEFIQRDYEYCMMGCVFENGDAYIPLTDRPVKFNSKLQETSYINYIEPITGEIVEEVKKIKALMREVRYVGLFSVEFMHDKVKDKIYFTEINFRNDGTNSFIVHGGVNLPYLHYQDLLGLTHKEYTPIDNSRKYIWEGIHFNALIYKKISVFEWMRDLIGSDGFLYYFPEDKKPFFKQFTHKFSGMGEKIKRRLKL